MELHSRNTNTLMNAAYAALAVRGIPRTSRNGPVLMIDEPVSVHLSHPQERVNFCPIRDANPFFHLWEALAMLGGVNSVHLMGFFAKNMLSYTDDGIRYNAFYGERARVTWGDQLLWVVKELEKNPDSRQCVLNLWSPTDWLKSTKDKACNLMMIFSVDHEGKLRMTSFNRSNDAIFGGVSGANIVHLSFFQEYVANALKREIGQWWHTSNNFHVYTENQKWVPLRDAAIRQKDSVDDVFTGAYPGHFQLLQNREVFDIELSHLLDLACASARIDGACIADEGTFNEPFIKHVAIPVFNAYVYYKAKQYDMAIQILDDCHAEDWRIACQTWIGRHRATKQISSCTPNA
jgi:hypothetical protein